MEFLQAPERGSVPSGSADLKEKLLVECSFFDTTHEVPPAEVPHPRRPWLNVHCKRRWLRFLMSCLLRSWKPAAAMRHELQSRFVLGGQSLRAAQRHPSRSGTNPQGSRLKMLHRLLFGCQSGREACVPWSLGPLCRELSRKTAEPESVAILLHCLLSTQAMEKHQIRRNFLVEDGIAAFEGAMHGMTARQPKMQSHTLATL